MSAVAKLKSISTPVLLVVLVLVMILVTVGVATGKAALSGNASAADRPVPQSAQMEDELGIRFSRVAVVGDGGLVMVSYVVLDAEKATRFQKNKESPPVLTSEARALSAERASLMKQGHELRTGQTYYLMYQNGKRALRSQESTRISAGSFQLANFPVL